MINLHDLLTKLVDKRPKIYVSLVLPEEVINSKKYHNVSMATDAIEFHFTHGLFRNEYFFKGKVKVDVD